jgi:hypothetical protein
MSASVAQILPVVRVTPLPTRQGAVYGNGRKGAVDRSGRDKLTVSFGRIYSRMAEYNHDDIRIVGITKAV